MSELPNEAITKQVAALAASGLNISQIASELSITRHQVRKIQAMDETKQALSQIGDEALKQAIITIRSKTSQLVQKALVALEKNLDKNELEAVKLVFKTVGVLDQPEAPAGDTNITIIAPGQSQDDGGRDPHGLA